MTAVRFAVTLGRRDILQIRGISGATQVFWNVDNVSECTVTSHYDSWTADSSGPSGQTSNPIYNRTAFVLSCTGLDGSSIRETSTVGVAPTFQEI
jgi:hypothetical protein